MSEEYSEAFTYLQRSHAQLLATPPLSDLGQIVHQTLKNISGV